MQIGTWKKKSHYEYKNRRTLFIFKQKHFNYMSHVNALLSQTAQGPNIARNKSCNKLANGNCFHTKLHTTMQTRSEHLDTSKFTQPVETSNWKWNPFSYINKQSASSVAKLLYLPGSTERYYRTKKDQPIQTFQKLLVLNQD